jgi:hypothetical protein
MIRNNLYFAIALMMFLFHQGFAQSKSAVQFYDSTGASKTGKIGWSGDAANGHFFLQTPADGEILKSKSGGVEVSGAMSATRFTGDGSGLTNLPSPAVTVGSVTGLQDSLNRKTDTNWVKARIAPKADTSWVSTKIANIGTAQIPDGAVTTAKIADKAVIDAKIDSVSWAKVKNKPATYASAGHGHIIDSVTGLQTALNGKANASTVTTLQGQVNSHSDSLTAHRNLINTKANTASPTFTGNVRITNSDSSGLKVDYSNSSVNSTDYIHLKRTALHFSYFGTLINDDVAPISAGNSSPLQFGYAKDATVGMFDFYAKIGANRIGDAVVRIYGKESGNFNNILELTHNGTDGIIRTVTGDINMIPATGILKVNGVQVSTSDVRFKKNIRPLDSSLQKVEKLNGIFYEFKTTDYPDKHFPNGRQIGLIAQDVEKTVPEVVVTDKEGYKSLAYDRLVALLIEAVKDQKMVMDRQNQEIDALKKDLVAVKAKVGLK